MTKLELAVYNELLRTKLLNEYETNEDIISLFDRLTDAAWAALTEDDRDEIEGWFCGTGITGLVDKVCTQTGLELSLYSFEWAVDAINTMLSRY